MKCIRISGIVIAFALVLMTLTVQPAMANPASRYESLKSLIDDNYVESLGGFSRIGKETSYTDSSYAATLILDKFGILDTRPPVYDLVKLKNLTWTLQWRSKAGEERYTRYGGFSEFLAGPVTIESTYTAISMYEILDKQVGVPGIEDVEVNWTSCADFINRTYHESGGFGRRVNDTPDVVSTYYALYSLAKATSRLENETLNEWIVNRSATIDYILSCREGDGFKFTPDSVKAGVLPTAAALMALSIIQSPLSSTDLNEVANWILNRQILPNTSNAIIGGFEEGIDTEDTNIESTYHALLALNLTGKLANVNETLAARFILDCQAKDGSWGFTPQMENGRLLYAAYAIECLELIGLSEMIHEEDPNNPPVPLVDWRLVLVVGLIVFALIIAAVAVRMD